MVYTVMLLWVLLNFKHFFGYGYISGSHVKDNWEPPPACCAHFWIALAHEDGEHEGLYAVLLCRVVGGRTKVVTNNDINIVPERKRLHIFTLGSTTTCRFSLRHVPFWGWTAGFCLRRSIPFSLWWSCNNTWKTLPMPGCNLDIFFAWCWHRSGGGRVAISWGKSHANMLHWTVTTFWSNRWRLFEILEQPFFVMDSPQLLVISNFRRPLLPCIGHFAWCSRLRIRKSAPNSLVTQNISELFRTYSIARTTLSSTFFSRRAFPLSMVSWFLCEHQRTEQTRLWTVGLAMLSFVVFRASWHDFQVDLKRHGDWTSTYWIGLCPPHFESSRIKRTPDNWEQNS